MTDLNSTLIAIARAGAARTEPTVEYRESDRRHDLADALADAGLDIREVADRLRISARRPLGPLPAFAAARAAIAKAAAALDAYEASL